MRWPDIGGAPDRRARRAAALAALGVALIYLAFVPPVIDTGDGASMFAVSESLIRHHSFTVPAALGTVGRNGNYYSSWYPLLSVVAVPFVWAGFLAGRLIGFPEHYAGMLFALAFSAIVSAATVYYVALLSLRLGASARGAITAALAYAFGTIAPVYARSFFAEPLLGLLTAAALYAALNNSRRDLLAASILAALAVLAKPTGLVVGVAIAGYLFLTRDSKRDAIWPLAGVAIGSGLFAGYNWLRFGNPLEAGRALAFSLSSLPIGSAGLLVSPGHGLIWYCPVVLAVFGLKKEDLNRPGVRVAIATAAAYFGLYSWYSNWWGGWCWGPRYLLPALAVLVAAFGLLDKRWRSIMVGLALAGFIATSPNLISFYTECYQEASQTKLSDQQVAWSPQWAPIVRIWGAAAEQMTDARRENVANVMRGLGHTAADGESSRAVRMRILAVWWWMLPAAKLPLAVGISIACLATALGLFLVRKALLECNE